MMIYKIKGKLSCVRWASPQNEAHATPYPMNILYLQFPWVLPFHRHNFNKAFESFETTSPLRVVGHPPAHALFSALLRFLSSNLQCYNPNKGFPASNYHYSRTLPKNEAARSKLKDSRSYFILWTPTSVHLRSQWARVAAQQCAAAFSS